MLQSDDASWWDEHFGTFPRSLSLFYQNRYWQKCTVTLWRHKVTSDDLSGVMMQQCTRGTKYSISGYASIWFEQIWCILEVLNSFALIVTCNWEVKPQNKRNHWFMRLKLPRKHVSHYSWAINTSFCDLSLTLTCTYHKHKTYTGSSPLFWEHFMEILGALLLTVGAFHDRSSKEISK